MNTIILAYRNRPAHLRLFLQALDQAAKHNTQGVEVLIADSSTHDAEDGYISDDGYYDWLLKNLVVRIHNYPPAEIFCKAKYLNDLALLSTGDLLTVLDVDCLCQPNLFTMIESFFAQKENANKKLAHRVQLMDAGTTKRFHSTAPGYGIDYLPRMLAMTTNFPIHPETNFDILTGGGLFTMPRSAFIALEGYDERFKGYGFEDHEFNLRAEKNGIETQVNTESPLFHLTHAKGGWGDPQLEISNRHLFMQKQRQAFPMPEPLGTMPLDPPPKPCRCFRSKG